MEVCKQNSGCLLFLCQVVQTSIIYEVAFNNLLKIAFSATSLFFRSLLCKSRIVSTTVVQKAGSMAQVVSALTALEIHSRLCCIYTPFFSVLTMKISQVIFYFSHCNCIFSFSQVKQAANRKREIGIKQL